VGQTEYRTYLRIDELLQLQQPLTPGAHDEMLFVVIHQVYELWFKLILHELDRVVAALLAGQPQEAIPGLRRTLSIEEVMIAQLHVLETMSPEGFLQFRDPLKPASGLQSGQFRAIEFLCGLRDADRIDDPVLSTADQTELRRRMATPTLYDALCTCLRACGLDVPDGDGEAEHGRRLRSLRDLYRDHAAAQRALLHQVGELLLDNDEAIARWRFHHTQMASREIGSRKGTGGLGVEYLRATVDRRFFPELWEVRALL
jgi:tryptophan 2,3-dioxygenase